MTLIESRDSNLPSSSVNLTTQRPWLNTDANLSSENHSNTARPLSPLTVPLQVGTISVSPITSGIRADLPRTTTMPPETRSAEFKRMEESITVVRQDSGQKYEMLMDTLRGQSIKLDQTIENQGAQINDIRNMMGTMAQQIEFTLLKLSHTSGDSSHNTARHTQIPERVEGRNKGVQDDRVPSYKVHKPKHFFPTFNGEDVHKWLFKCTQYFDMKDVADSEKLQITSY